MSSLLPYLLFALFLYGFVLAYRWRGGGNAYYPHRDGQGPVAAISLWVRPTLRPAGMAAPEPVTVVGAALAETAAAVAARRPR